MLLTTRAATPTDYPYIDTLLYDAAMVPACYDPPSRWWVVCDATDTVIAAVGAELGPSAWLLRSCVVTAAHRQAGIGKHLVATVLAAATAAAIPVVVCFGTDVGDYWARRGFRRISVPELCECVPNAPQIAQFTANGWLADEWAWRIDL